MIIKKKKLKNIFIIKASEVRAFSLEGAEDIYESRLLIDKENVGIETISMSQFTLKPGKKNNPGIHPCPYDEIYYILKGNGILYVDNNEKQYKLYAGTVVFIPCGVKHYLENKGTENLELLGIFPYQLKPGVNKIYDERKKKWGKSFIHKT